MEGEGMVDEAPTRRLEETKRLARVLRIATLLASHPYQHTRAALATLYKVTERPIDRDLELLRGLGYEIARECGWVHAHGKRAILLV